MASRTPPKRLSPEEFDARQREKLTYSEFTALRGATGASIQKIKKNPVVSKAKAQIELIFMALKCDVVREYKFHEKRRWKFDFCVPEIRLAIEYEGLPLQVEKSRHTTISGFCNDCEKYSEAAILGWCVIRVNALSVESGLAHTLIKQAVDSRRRTPGVMMRSTSEDI